jgi:hypothetical protein
MALVAAFRHHRHRANTERAQALYGRWITYAGPQRQIWTFDSHGHFWFEVDGGPERQPEPDACWRIVDEYVEVDWDISPISAWTIFTDPGFWHWSALAEWFSVRPPRFKIESLSADKIVMQDPLGSPKILNREF